MNKIKQREDYLWSLGFLAGAGGQRSCFVLSLQAEQNYDLWLMLAPSGLSRFIYMYIYIDVCVFGFF